MSMIEGFMNFAKMVSKGMKPDEAKAAAKGIVELMNAAKVAEAGGETTLKAAAQAEARAALQAELAGHREMLGAQKELAVRSGSKTQSRIADEMAARQTEELALAERLGAQGLSEEEIAAQLEFQARKARQRIGMPNRYLQAVPVAGAGVAASAAESVSPTPTTRLMPTD